MSHPFAAIDSAMDDLAAAILASDVARLEAMTTPGLIWVHGNGVADARGAFLGALASGAARSVQFQPTDMAIQDFGSTLLVTGRLDLAVEARGERRAGRSQFAALWLVGSRPLLAHWQNTRIAVG